jgi:septal ring factor EnvC (AmiA/AmiB activator)
MSLEYKLQELKHDYVRVQGDLEKVESTGHNTDKLEAQLHSIEDEIAQVKAAIKENNSNR